MPKFFDWVRAPFLSPLGLVARALLIVVLYGVCEFAGGREHTTFISGTATSVDAGIGSSVTFGLTYMLAYFGLILVAPIFLLAAGILTLWKRNL